MKWFSIALVQAIFVGIHNLAIQPSRLRVILARGLWNRNPLFKNASPIAMLNIWDRLESSPARYGCFMKLMRTTRWNTFLRKMFALDQTMATDRLWNL